MKKRNRLKKAGIATLFDSADRHWSSFAHIGRNADAANSFTQKW